MIKCPNCVRDIDEVITYWECRKKTKLEGKKMVEHGRVIEFIRIVAIRCIRCNENVDGLVKEDKRFGNNEWIT